MLHDESLREEALRHTAEGCAPLVPEIPLRLLKDDSPLWAAFRGGPEAERLSRPYWAFAWAGGQGLARYLLDRPEMTAGRRVLDFGAGSGIAGIAAARAGAAEVAASDIDPMAVAAIAINAELNGVRVQALCEDFLHCENPGWDVVLAGDIWYDASLSMKAIRWLRRLAGQGVLVLTGDPGRHFSHLNGLEELACYGARSVPDVDYADLATVRVLRVEP